MPGVLVIKKYLRVYLLSLMRVILDRYRILADGFEKHVHDFQEARIRNGSLFASL